VSVELRSKAVKAAGSISRPVPGTLEVGFLEESEVVMGIHRVAAVLVFLAACGGSTFDGASINTETGSGGSSSASGGASGSAGSTSTAGSNGDGGFTGASGGAGNSGGSTGGGGHLGSGGVAQTGGSTGSGGVAGSGGSTTQTGGMTGSGGGVGTGGSMSDGGVSCGDLLNKANILLGEAQVCNGNVPTECASTIAGWCGCPVLVSSPSSYITTQYLAALKNYDTQCPHACPGYCLMVTTGTCGAAIDGGLRKCVRTG
jgi:hypothetical protein